MLRTENLTFAYNSSNSFQFPDIQCTKNQNLLIIGESGTGKTTLLHILAGLLKASKGKVWIEDTELNSLSDVQIDRFRGKNIGLVFQKSHFVSALSVKDNLRLAQSLAGEKKDMEKIKTLLHRLNIEHKLNSKPSQLSQGEQQRVAIARALLNQPKLILADEPTSGLDDKNCKQVADLLEEQAKIVGSCLVIVTHDGRLKERFTNQIEL